MFLENQPPAYDGESVPDGMTGTRFREHCNVDLGCCHSDWRGNHWLWALISFLPNILYLYRCVYSDIDTS